MKTPRINRKLRMFMILNQVIEHAVNLLLYLLGPGGVPAAIA